ncbi:G/U mismatch-specific uracil-DNA glycosylase [Pontibacter ummariensis]|uniref:G/U mismatch-specific uracil-DNA glycosylase n=2 Tax=Pontibacter ummariensis TaxID=1610492 RepID=A0A239IQE0_9BACT|nr:G/U mismatch-specific uracil-DNA glycosylase [Pontibacter ummariensis]SNS95781.1 G/U mismatch-specific uracil-DNA glycosylase [Pontibacter ummariensis]
MKRYKPTKEEILAAAGKTVPDLIAPDLRVLFCGINPSLYTAATGYNFARPGNRFWPTLHAAGFTPRRLQPEEQQELLSYGCGITNFVERATVAAAELNKQELVAGGKLLVEKVLHYKPRVLAMLGVTAYRDAFGRRDAAIGLQPETIGDTRLWVLPNPSGLNAHYTPDALARVYGELREAL